jgi:hypothetical protein
MKAEPIEIRLWRKIKIAGEDECWEWQAYKTKQGYGVVGLKSKTALAHRVAFELKNGPVKDGMCVMHICDNPSCCNPKHLKAGTIAENNADRHSKNRSRGASHKGTKNPSARLKEEQVVQVYNASGTLQSIADRFGIKMQTVHDIKRGRIWSWLTNANHRAGQNFR